MIAMTFLVLFHLIPSGESFHRNCRPAVELDNTTCCNLIPNSCSLKSLNSSDFMCVAKDCIKMVTDVMFNQFDDGTYPVFSDDPEVRVYFAVAPQALEGLSSDGVLSLKLRVALAWHNEFMRWDKTMCNYNCVNDDGCRAACLRDSLKLENLTHFVLKPKNTKVYDFLVANETRNPVLQQSLKNFPIKVQRNGSVAWSGFVSVSVQCRIDVKLYPFDEQKCSLVFESLPPGGKNVSVRFAHEPKGLPVVDSAGWSLKSFSLTKRGDGFDVLVRRNSANVVVTLVVPCSLFNILICFVYAIPLCSGERVGYSVTLVLTFSVLIMQLNSHIPTSEMTYLSVFIIVTFVQSAVALMETVFILAFTRHVEYLEVQREKKLVSEKKENVTAEKKNDVPFSQLIAIWVNRFFLIFNAFFTVVLFINIFCKIIPS